MTAWLDTALVESPIHYCLCTSKKQFEKELKRLNVSEKVEWVRKGFSATAHHLVSGDGSQCTIVGFKPDKKCTPEQHYCLLVHEAVHIWQEIRVAIGEDKPSAEFEAYAIQRISQALIESFNDQMKAKR